MIPVAGFQPFTTIDFPGHLSCVIFTQGCPWKCRYCQNTELLPFKSRGDETSKAWGDVCAYLENRKGLLDAVVFSGGEASAHSGLVEALVYVRSLGYKTGLHTAGIYPKKLATLLPLLDWVGFDFKAPLDHRYDQITQVRHSAEAVRESLDRVQESGVDVQFRCTWHPLLLKENDLAEMRNFLGRKFPGSELIIQNFSPRGCRDSELNAFGSARYSSP